MAQVITTREQAMKWWNELPVFETNSYTNTYFKGRTWTTLTGREIETMWRAVNNRPSSTIKADAAINFKHLWSVNITSLKEVDSYTELNIYVLHPNLIKLLVGLELTDNLMLYKFVGTRVNIVTKNKDDYTISTIEIELNKFKPCNNEECSS